MQDEKLLFQPVKHHLQDPGYCFLASISVLQYLLSFVSIMSVAMVLNRIKPCK